MRFEMPCGVQPEIIAKQSTLRTNVPKNYNDNLISTVSASGSNVDAGKQIVGKNPFLCYYICVGRK